MVLSVKGRMQFPDALVAALLRMRARCMTRLGAPGAAEVDEFSRSLDDTLAKSVIGRRVRLRSIEVAYGILQPGDEGTVDWVDEAGGVHVDWDRGGHPAPGPPGLIPGKDVWEWL
jgi:hypothetical protein